MASMIIRNLDEAVKSRLRVQAARQGRSMEEEAREILKNGLKDDSAAGSNLAESIRRHLEPFGGVKLKLARREPAGRGVDFHR